jgi:hypothetical protein
VTLNSTRSGPIGQFEYARRVAEGARQPTFELEHPGALDAALERIEAGVREDQRAV